MLKTSFRKKRFRRDTRGVSGIIATIFLVLIILLVSTNVFTFVINKNTGFQDVVSEVNQMDIDQNSEKIISSNLNYTVVGDEVSIHVLVKNDGPVSVQLVTLWIVDETTGKYGYNDTLDINLKTGDILYFTDSTALKVRIKDSNSSDIFTSWFVTARGNLIPLQTAGDTQEVIVAQVALGIGALALDFDNFRYFTYASPTKLARYPNGTASYDIPAGEYMAFGCYLTNFDIKKRTITLDSHSLFWQPGRTGVGEGSWFIVNPNPDGTINGTYTPITMKYGETKMLIFASKFDLGLGSFDRLKTDNAVATVATFLLLHGTLDSQAFAQSIPFVSLFYN